MTLPNFIMIGVAKAGTTSLFHYLDQHPDIYMCPIKGTNYFGYYDARSWQWYDEGNPPALQNFPVRSFSTFLEQFAGANGQAVIGEVSPQYLRCPNAARRIYDTIPGARLVASLRNPADRAFSGFLMRTRRGEVVKSCYEELCSESGHVKEGFYYRRLKRYFDLFPKEKIKVYIFEEFKKNSAQVVTDLFGFLNVDTSFKPDTSVAHNPAAVPKIRALNRLYFNPTVIRITKAILPSPVQNMAKWIQQQNQKPAPRLPADLRHKLIEIYRQDILQLETLLDRDLSIWLDNV
jgi:hypothetical protein